MRSKANTAPNRTRCHKYTKKKKLRSTKPKWMSHKLWLVILCLQSNKQIVILKTNAFVSFFFFLEGGGHQNKGINLSKQAKLTFVRFLPWKDCTFITESAWGIHVGVHSKYIIYIAPVKRHRYCRNIQTVPAMSWANRPWKRPS